MKISDENLEKWADKTKEEIFNKYALDQEKICKLESDNFWRITRYECTLVRRDKHWWFSIVPDIIKFWDEVVYYRKNGNQEIQDKINKRKRKKKPEQKEEKKVFVIPTLAEGCQIMESSDEDN